MKCGRKRGLPRWSGRRGFTLIEILLVLALLSLLVGLFIGGASDFFRAQEKSMSDIFWDSVQAARLQAVEGDRTIEMRYDEKKHQLRWGAGETAASAAWPGKGLEFLPAERGDTVLIGGQLKETSKMQVVRFYADGCAENFRAQLTGPDGRISYVEIDQWTCARITRKNP